MGSRKVKVQCALTVEIEVPSGWTDEDIRFSVEENSCPGTQIVGAAIEAAIRRGKENGVCWACSLQGTNKIIHE